MPILRFGTDDQKERFLKPLARGEMLGAFCLTEPGGGSDASALTRAKRDGDHYVLNGTKQFITTGSSPTSRWSSRVTDPALGQAGISAFIVPTDNPGWWSARVEEKLGQRASDTCQILLRGPARPPDRLGEEGRGYRIALANLEGGRIGIAAQAVGMARAAYEVAPAYARERKSSASRSSSIRRSASGWPRWLTRDRDCAPADDCMDAAPAARPRRALPDGGLHGQAVRVGGGRVGVLRGDPDPGRLRLPRPTSRSSASTATPASAASTKAPTTSSIW
jgi:hypothetical protein